MSNLILPVKEMPRRHEIKLPVIEVPAPLREDFVVNPHMEVEFYRAVQKAMDKSLRTEETAIREPTVEALKQRIEMCYNTVVVMRMEMKYPLAKCCDLLPQYFMRALVEGKRPEDLIEKAATGTAWDKGSEPEKVVVPRDPEADLNESE